MDYEVVLDRKRLSAFPEIRPDQSKHSYVLKNGGTV